MDADVQRLKLMNTVAFWGSGTLTVSRWTVTICKKDKCNAHNPSTVIETRGDNAQAHFGLLSNFLRLLAVWWPGHKIELSFLLLLWLLMLLPAW